MRQRIRHFVGIVFLILGGLLGGITLAELALRAAGISFPVFDDYDGLRGVALRPGKEGWYRKEGSAYIKINALGYRDVDHELKKTPGTFRIAVLGDSFAEARQVAFEDTFWSYLSQQLPNCPALSGRKVEVLNFGIGGYSTAQELLTLRKDTLRFAPDLVVLAFFAGNDVQDNSKELNEGNEFRMSRPAYSLKDGQLVLDNSFSTSFSQQLLYEGIQHLRVLEVVNEGRRAWAVRNTQQAPDLTQAGFDLGTSAEIYGPPRNTAWRDAWAITEQLLAQMKREVIASGARFIVMTVTEPEQVHPDNNARSALEKRLEVDNLFYPDHRIVEIGRKHGFPVITLAERMQRLAVNQHVYFHGFKNTVMGRGHWNEAGHQIVGRLLVEGICGEMLDAEP